MATTKRQIKMTTTSIRVGTQPISINDNVSTSTSTSSGSKNSNDKEGNK